jgi:hypothetical protein
MEPCQLQLLRSVMNEEACLIFKAGSRNPNYWQLGLKCWHLEMTAIRLPPPSSLDQCSLIIPCSNFVKTFGRLFLAVRLHVMTVRWELDGNSWICMSSSHGSQVNIDQVIRGCKVCWHCGGCQAREACLSPKAHDAKYTVV